MSRQTAKNKSKVGRHYISLAPCI